MNSRKEIETIEPVHELDDLKNYRRTGILGAVGRRLARITSTGLLLLTLGIGYSAGIVGCGDDDSGQTKIEQPDDHEDIPPEYDINDFLTFDGLDTYLDWQTADLPDEVTGTLVQPHQMLDVYANNTNNARDLLGAYFAKIVTESDGELLPVPLSSDGTTNRTVDNLMGNLNNNDGFFDSLVYQVVGDEIYFRFRDENGETLENGMFVINDAALADAVKKAMEEPVDIPEEIEYKIDLTKDIAEVILGDDNPDNDSVKYDLRVQKITRKGMEKPVVEDIEKPDVVYTVKMGDTLETLAAGEEATMEDSGNKVKVSVDEFGDLRAEHDPEFYGSNELFMVTANITIEDPDLEEGVYNEQKSGQHGVKHQDPIDPDPVYGLQDAEYLEGIAFTNYSETMPTGFSYEADAGTLKSALELAINSGLIDNLPTFQQEVEEDVTLADAILGIDTNEDGVPDTGYMDGIGDDMVTVRATAAGQGSENYQVGIQFADGTIGVSNDDQIARDWYLLLDNFMAW